MQVPFNKFSLAAIVCLAAGCARPPNSGPAVDKAAQLAEAHQYDARANEKFGQQVELMNSGSLGGNPLPGNGGTDTEEDLATVLPECGLKDVLSKTDQITIESVINYDYIRIIHAGFGKAIVPLTSILDLKGTLEKTTLNVGVKVGAVSGINHDVALNDVKPIEDRAEKLAAQFRGPASAYLVKGAANFGKGWKGILCSIIGADRIVNDRAGFKTETTFDPPVPPNISPIADRIRYEKELGDYKYFNNVKATVVATNHPRLQKGQVLIGSVLVEKIPNKKTTRWCGDIEGDIAYRVSNNFGTAEETLALGFHIWTEYYIDLKNRKFSSVIANVGDEETMHFIDGKPCDLSKVNREE